MIKATKKWLFLKISSLIMVPLMLWFLLNFASLYDSSYNEILAFLSSQPSKLFFSLFLVSMFFYSSDPTLRNAQIGTQTPTPPDQILGFLQLHGFNTQ